MIYDLTMDLDENTPMFPDCPKPEIKQIATIKKKGWNEKLISISSHCGTHIDAPLHFFEDGKSLSDYPIDKFVGYTVVIDARGENITRPNLDNVKEGDIVFFYTGFSDIIHRSEYYKNNPTLSMETAQELVRKKIKIFGIDSWTTDNEPYEAHKLLLKNKVLVVENLVNLDKLIGKRFMCYILPLKIKDADAAPCRVIGVL